MKRQFDEVADRPGEFLGLEGDLQMVKNIEFVDQNPIGKSSRSNPVTSVSYTHLIILKNRVRAIRCSAAGISQPTTSCFKCIARVR